MSQPPFVSVVVETVTTFEHGATAPLADLLTATLSSLNRQSYPRDQFEVIVVLDATVDKAEVAGLQAKYPSIQVTFAPAPNYFAHKNAGAACARGTVVALVDGDCEAASDWIAQLVGRFEPDVAAVAGRTHYTGRSVTARTFSIPDFATVGATPAGTASGLMVNNLALRRDVLLAHPLDARARRNGGCYLLYHELRAAGARMVYESGAVVAHGIDIAGLGFVRKHFDRGFDGVGIYRIDDHNVLRGTPVFRRFGALALIPLTARRIALDWVRLTRDRRQLGISMFALPYFWAVMLTTRLIELAGGLVAALGPDRDTGADASLTR